MSLDVRNWNNIMYANFTDNGTANGAMNWTVIENVNKTDVFTLGNVKIITPSNFTVQVTNQTTEVILWSMKLTGIYNNITNRSGSICKFTGSSSYISMLTDFSSPCVNSTYNFRIFSGCTRCRISGGFCLSTGESYRSLYLLGWRGRFIPICP